MYIYVYINWGPDRIKWVVNSFYLSCVLLISFIKGFTEGLFKKIAELNISWIVWIFITGIRAFTKIIKQITKDTLFFLILKRDISMREPLKDVEKTRPFDLETKAMFRSHIFNDGLLNHSSGRPLEHVVSVLLISWSNQWEIGPS